MLMVVSSLAVVILDDEVIWLCRKSRCKDVYLLVLFYRANMDDVDGTH